jgi:hypothetical protein
MNTRKEKIMKKLYMKPTASSVEYAVNENIAISTGLDMDNILGAPGDISYQNTDRSLCNKVIINTGVETGVLPGVTNIHQVLAALALAAEPYKKDPVAYANTPFMQLKNALDQLGPDGFNC